MKFTLALYFCFCSYLVLSQAEFPYFPSNVYGMNKQTKGLKRIKSKNVTYYQTADTLTGYYEYDKKGRLITRFDSQQGDSVYFVYDNTYEWVLQLSIEGDTIAIRTIQSDGKQKYIRATIVKNGYESFYEVQKVNDTLFQVYSNEYSNKYLQYSILLDKQERVKRFVRSNKWQTIYSYGSDTLFTTVYESSGDTSIISTTVYQNREVQLIDETFVGEGRYQYKHEYNADNKIIRTLYGIFYNGSFMYYLKGEYDYNKSGQLIKETHYQQWGAIDREIIYTYY